MRSLLILPLILLALLWLASRAQAQPDRPPVYPAALDSNTEPGSNPTWRRFLGSVNISALAMFSRNGTRYFGLSSNDSLPPERIELDSLGFTHVRFRQYHRGIPVEGAEARLHERNGRCETFNGRIIAGMNPNMQVLITAQQALDSAMQFIGASTWMWQDSTMEAHYRELKGTPRATYYPYPSLALIRPDSSRHWLPGQFLLTWCMELYALEPLDAWKVYVSVQTGKVIQMRQIALTCGTSHKQDEETQAMPALPQPPAPHKALCLSGTGNTSFNGTQTIWTSQNNNNQFFLNDDCQGSVLRTRFYAGANNSNIQDYFDGNNTWTDAGDSAGVQTHWGIERSDQYFRNVHSRSGWDDNEGNINAYNNRTFAGPNNTTTPNNAQWSGGNTFYGAGNTNATTDDWNCLDICGHELTHGVVSSSAGLVYRREPGALNESFADIFGTTIEQWVTGSFDWFMGGQRLGPGSGGAVRNMANPSSFNNPDTYLRTNWINTDCGTPNGGNDFCGVHTNSGVLNFCFVLLTDGGNGTNDNGETYSVSALGITKARRIAYRALNNYLTSEDQYIDARNAFLQAAEDLYGVCSNEAIQVGKAFYAVGVDPAQLTYNRQACGVYLPLLFSNRLSAIRNLTAAGSCSASVLPNGNALYTFRAGQDITLSPGFDTLPGANFIAEIDECVYTLR